MSFGRRWKWVARAGLMAWASLILTLTLFPIPGGSIPPTSVCLICGGRGLADGILNVFLFVPLGWGLVAVWRGSRWSLLATIVLAVGIEVTQILVPGRHPSLGDVVFNVTGAVAGAMLFRSRGSWLLPRSAAVRSRLTVLASGFAVAVIVSTALLLEPSFPVDSAYFGQWTPELGHLENYQGRVVSARIGDRPVGPARLGGDEELRRELYAGPSLEVTVEIGPPPRDLAPIFSVFDGRGREIVLIGADQTDLVFRKRTRSAVARLDAPDWRWRGALGGLESGRVASVAVVDSSRRGVCMRVDQAEACGLGHTVGSGWALLLSRPWHIGWLSRLLGVAWLAALALPVGWWAPGWRGLLAGLTMPLVAAAALPAFTELLATGPVLLGAMLLGALGGWALQLAFRGWTADGGV